MGFNGIDKEKARALTGALDVASGALSIQGPLISGILARWQGDQGKIGTFPPQATWSTDQAKDIRRRVGILESDPEAVLTAMGLGGVLERWQDMKDHPEKYQEYLDEANHLKKDLTTPLRVTKIMSGVEASLQLYQRWNQGQNVAGARAVLELNRMFGVGDERINAKHVELVRELIKANQIQDMYKQPWKWQTATRALLDKWKIPLPGTVLRQAPGLSILDRIGLPLAAVHGGKEMILPDHKGVLGGFDRGMGAVELGGAAAVMGGEAAALGLGASVGVAAAVPVVGWAALGVAGAYFLGTWAYDHRAQIKATAQKAWNATTDAAEKLGDKAKDTAKGAVNAAIKMHVLPASVKKLKFW
ncbi:hypothetical protein Q3V23_21700 [Streptomyces sp. VNUA116]|uniref:hypothetical protein n=1 Tax=Streptomyces sp. VNUA116 TaxID=3062449 RepID=UPI002674C146|nr:hypothetical protein [Streptomyces sp. VNUA116]WKU46458.1 hypothetical protein Q3V23_21700 [Streptomyces sp. VNUA116]